MRELADARNVWAPNGRVEARPGYWGVARASLNSDNASWATVNLIVKETPINTFTTTTTLDALGVEKRWHIRLSAVPSEAIYPYGLQDANIGAANSANANDMSAMLEYWNGDSWVGISHVEYVISAGAKVTKHLSSAVTGTNFFFVFPRDMALKALSSEDPGYYLRFTLKPVNGSTALTAGTRVDTSTFWLGLSRASGLQFLYSVAAGFPTGFRYLNVEAVLGTGEYFVNSGTISGPDSANEQRALATTSLLRYTLNELPAVAVVSQFGEFYVSYDYITTVHKAKILSTADTVSAAVVESDQDLVGPGKLYDSAFIPQLGTWPAAKYIAYHRGEMWAANLKDGGSTSVRWSAGSQGYRVWPTINIDVVEDTDQGPITALFPFNQNMFVFKSDSIWQMVYTGLNAASLNTYRAEKIVPGAGCVSNSSIQEIKGKLVFLGEDGVYLFDGGQTKRISDRIQKTIDSIVPGKRAFASSVHWKTKSLYLLAVTTQGYSANNLVLVWDYKNDSWWIWDNIEAVTFLSVEDGTDTQRVYFVDFGGRTFEFGVGTHDYGEAITATATSHRLGESDLNRKIRLVNVNSTNMSAAVTVEVKTNDAPFDGATTSSLTYSDSAEGKYGVGVYGTATYIGERDRNEGIGVLQGGDWVRVKLTHATKTPFAFNSIDVGLIPTGIRK